MFGKIATLQSRSSKKNDFLNRFGKIKNGPTTPLCATFFLSTFFSFHRPRPALSFLYFFLSLFLDWLTPLILHCLRIFVCADEHVCSSGIFAVFLVSHATVDFSLLFSFCTSFFVVAALLFDSIVSNCTTTQSYNTYSSHRTPHPFL